MTRATDEETLAWRVQAAEWLERHGMSAVDPFRGESLANQRNGAADGWTLDRDHHDVVHADAILANLKGAQHVSIGSCFELAWAFDHRVPIALVMESKPDGQLDGAPSNNIHEHIFVRRTVTWRHETMIEALESLRAFLAPQLR
jgi:nucleoside 2-deoxyribosyltransferase